MQIFNHHTLGQLLNGPWGQKPRGDKASDKGADKGGDSGAGTGNPEIDDMIRSAQDRFRNFGGGHFGGGKRASGGADDSHGMVLALLALLAAIWLGTGFYRVEPEENAVIMTFGKWTGTRPESGLGYHLPFPVQDVVKVNVGFDRRIEVGYREGSAGVPAESIMLTGDENIIDINFVVLWRISDAGKYLFRIRDPESTIKKVAESAMREVIGRTQIQKALTESRGEVETQTRALMQKILDEYEAGVSINSVQLLKVDPPSEVVDAFDDVQRARTDLERLKNEAETYRNDIVPKARGEAQKMQQDAEAYKSAVISKATGEAGRFMSVLAAYEQAREVTQKRIYLETMEAVLKNTKKVITGDKTGAALVPYLNVDAAKTDKKGEQK